MRPQCSSEASAPGRGSRSRQGRYMVKRLAGRLSKGAVAVLKATVQRLDTAQRKRLAAQLVEAAFGGDFDRSFLAVERVLAQRKLDVGQRERLLSAAFSGLDATSVPAALLERFLSMSGGSLHYSQDGEDIVLNRLLGERGEGFYVDIGAHHATRFSNTFSLYRR